MGLRHLDAIIFLATRAQPSTKLHCLSVDPIALRELLACELALRKTSADPVATQLLDSIKQVGDN